MVSVCSDGQVVATSTTLTTVEANVNCVTPADGVLYCGLGALPHCQGATGGRRGSVRVAFWRSREAMGCLGYHAVRDIVPPWDAMRGGDGAAWRGLRRKWSSVEAV